MDIHYDTESGTASKLLSVFIWIPMLLTLGIVTVIACAGYFIYRYLDELMYLVMGGITFILGGSF